MLSARAYSFRQKSKLAISLSWIGGYVNTVLFLICGSFAAHMSGKSDERLFLWSYWLLGRWVGQQA